MKKILNIQNQIIQKKFYKSKIQNFSKSLLKHDIFNSNSKKNEKKKFTKNRIRKFSHVYTNKKFFKTYFQSSKLNVDFDINVFIDDLLSNSNLLINKLLSQKKTMKLYFKFIDKNVKSLISFVIKNIEKFKKNVVDRSID